MLFCVSRLWAAFYFIIMAITKQKKEEILKSLQDNMKTAKVIIFINFHGLNVASANELRRILRNAGAGFMVAKKTLIRLALKNFGLEGEIPALEGEVAMAFSGEDPAVCAKELKNFAKKNGIKLLGGVLENKIIGKEAIIMLANIPPREVLLGQFINVINSPIQGLVGTLNGVTRNFVGVLNEIKNSRS